MRHCNRDTRCWLCCLADHPCFALAPQDVALAREAGAEPAVGLCISRFKNGKGLSYKTRSSRLEPRERAPSDSRFLCCLFTWLTFGDNTRERQERAVPNLFLRSGISRVSFLFFFLGSRVLKFSRADQHRTLKRGAEADHLSTPRLDAANRTKRERHVFRQPEDLGRPARGVQHSLGCFYTAFPPSTLLSCN